MDASRHINMSMTCELYNQPVSAGPHDVLGVARSTRVKPGYCLINCPQCGQKRDKELSDDAVELLIHAGVPEITPRLTEEEVDQFARDLNKATDIIKEAL